MEELEDKKTCAECVKWNVVCFDTVPPQQLEACDEFKST